MKKLIPFSYFGGKASHLDFILPHLPKTRVYVELFGGSGAVLLNREASPVECYNDIYGEIVVFFKVLREQPEKLVALLEMTPYARDELAIACQPTFNELEIARRVFVRAKSARNSQLQTTRPSAWARSLKENMAKQFYGKVDQLLAVSQRLQRVQIEDKPALDLIAPFDSLDTLFYVDPPYLHETRQSKNIYSNEMDYSQHHAMCLALNQVKGRVALSGYDNELYNSLLFAPKWTKLVAAKKSIGSSGGIAGKESRNNNEALWVNY